MSDWIKWNGGECPVPAGTHIEFCMRENPREKHLARAPELLRWSNTGSMADVVNYRIVQEAKPAPKEDEHEALTFHALSESDPNGKRPHEMGAKLDAGKSPVRRGLLEYFPRACMAVADVSASGAKKYTWNGWETVENGVDRYGDAEVRHICKRAIEGPVDPDYGHMHAAHEAWNALARLELILREMEKRNEHP